MTRTTFVTHAYEPNLTVVSESQGAATWNRVVVVSNRLPFRYAVGENGSISLVPSSGGLVTALTPLLHKGVGGKWVGWLGGEEEGLEEALRSLAENGPGQYDLGVVSLTPEEERDYYHGYSNQVLVPLLSEAAVEADLSVANRCWPSYLRAQRVFATEVARDIRLGDIVWVHDYHLIGVGRELRSRGIRAPLGFFLHTPFPRWRAFKSLPSYQARMLLTALLTYDTLGFQTRRFQENFLEAVRSSLSGVSVTAGDDGTSLTYRGHKTRIGIFPVSIDVDAFERQLFAQKTQRNIERLDKVLRKDPEFQIIFNAGRQDYAKGFREELKAFDVLLQRYPEFTSKVVLIQLVIPSRAEVGAYQEYKRQIIDLAAEINRRHGRKVVRQIHAGMRTARYLAHLHVANVQSIPTLADGMNLIAKESAVVGHKTTVLVLGKDAGSAQELGTHALLVDPRDFSAFADVFYRALTMRLRDRRYRKSQLKGIVTMHDVFDWWTGGVERAFQTVWDEMHA